METLNVRLLNRIVKSQSGCWEWKGALRSGYGAIKLNGKVYGAHRISYQTFIGEIPEGFQVCHKCDNKKCINPEHLFVGTNSDNMIDCLMKGRIKIPDGKKFEKGYRHPKRSLTDEQVKRIKEVMRSGFSNSPSEIGELFGVSRYRINDIRHGNTYADID